jgi:hypothetical protein
MQLLVEVNVMRKFFIFGMIVALLLLVGANAVTYTAITAVSSLDSENDFARAPGSWNTLLSNGSINYYDWPDGYDVLIVGFNFTSSYNTTLDYFDIIAGDNPPAFRASIGNYSFDAPTPAGVYWFGPLESARFKNSTGYLQISSGYMVGKLAIMKVKG